MQQSYITHRFVLLDIIRTIACALVIFRHITGYFNVLDINWGIQKFYYVSWGGIGVTLFIILSGLLLQIHNGSRKYQYKDFIIRRIWRIYPVYLICLVIAAIIYGIYNYHTNGSAIYGLHYYDIILSITGLYALVGLWGGPLIGTSWYIGTIMCLYLLFPFLSWAFSKNALATLISLLLISVASRLIVGFGIISLQGYPTEWFPLCRVFEFGLGIYIALITHNLRCLNSQRTNSFFKFTAVISFPVFLIHFPLIVVLAYLISIGIDIVTSIIIYMIVVVTISWLINLLDNYIQIHFANKSLRNMT